MSAATPSALAAVKRGRPREFELDDVLDRAVQLFWDKGYEAASVAELVEATGLSKSSLYGTFGSKEALFERAIDRYVETRVAMLTSVLAEGSLGLDDVAAFLQLVESEVDSDLGARGCLAVNTSTELGYRDDAVQTVCSGYRTHVRAALQAVFSRAEERGEVAPGSSQDYAELLLGWMLGVAVVVRGGADRAELEGQFRAARALIGAWRLH